MKKPLKENNVVVEFQVEWDEEALDVFQGYISVV